MLYPPQLRAVWDLTTPGTTPKAIGLTRGGGRKTVDPRELALGISGQYAIIGGPVEPRATWEGYVTRDTLALLLLALRTSYTVPALTSLKVTSGTDATNWLLSAAVLAKATIKMVQAKPVEATLEFMGLDDVTTAAALSAVALGGDVITWAGGVITIGGAAYKIEDATITIDNNVSFLYDLDAKASNAKRMPSGLLIDQEAIGYETTCREVMTWDPTDDTIVSNFASIVALSDGTKTLTATFANLSHEGSPGPDFITQGVVKYGYRWIGPPGCLTMVVAP